MPGHRQLAGRTIAGLLLIAIVAACSAIGPDLHVEIDNTAGLKAATVTVDSSGPGMTGGEDVDVLPGQGAAWRVPLGSTWEIKVDGRHVIGSGDRTDFALSSDWPWQDLIIRMQIVADGTVKLLDAP
jgi:hypothetical protein